MWVFEPFEGGSGFLREKFTQNSPKKSELGSRGTEIATFPVKI